MTDPNSTSPPPASAAEFRPVALPYSEWVERACQLWLAVHASDSEQELKQEIARLQREIGSGHHAPLWHDLNIKRGQLRLAQQLLERHRITMPPIQITAAPREPRKKPPPKVRPEPLTSSQVEKPSGNVADADERRKAKERLFAGLRQLAEEDGRVAQIAELQQQATRLRGEFSRLMEQVKNPTSRYITDKEIQDAMSRLLAIAHDIAVLRDGLERDLHVTPDDANSWIWPLVDKDYGRGDSVDFAEALALLQRRRLDSLAQKYGLGRQPLRPPGSKGREFSTDEMRKDAASILSPARQRQLLGIDGPDEQEAAVIGRVTEIARKQINARIDEVVSRLERNSAGVSQKEVSDLMVEALGHQRQAELLGGSAGINIAKLIDAAIKRDQQQTKLAIERIVRRIEQVGSGASKSEVENELRALLVQQLAKTKQLELRGAETDDRALQQLLEAREKLAKTVQKQ